MVELSPPAAGAGGGEGVAGGSASSTATIGGSSKARHASTVLLGDLAKIAVEYSDHRKALFDKLSVLCLAFPLNRRGDTEPYVQSAQAYLP